MEPRSYRGHRWQDTIRVACVHATLVIAKMLNADEFPPQRSSFLGWMVGLRAGCADTLGSESRAPDQRHVHVMSCCSAGLGRRLSGLKVLFEPYSWTRCRKHVTLHQESSAHSAGHQGVPVACNHFSSWNKRTSHHALLSFSSVVVLRSCGRCEMHVPGAPG